MNKDVLISAVADLHGHLPEMPPADLCVVCGDIFPGGLDSDPYAQGQWFRSIFLPWVERQECNHVVLVAGNHDHWIEKNNGALLEEFTPEALKKLVYLCDSGWEFKGLTVYGTPWVPTPFVNKAFSSDDDAFLRDRFSRIPQHVDLLLTHTVPYGCDGIGYSERDAQDLGSRELRRAVETRDVRFLVVGHIHETSERTARMDFGGHCTEMLNAACCDNRKVPVREPVRFPVSVRPESGRAAPFRIACVGDSITYGYGLKDILAESYPARLTDMLGEGFEVKNFGRNGAGLWTGGAFPYTSTIEYSRAVDYEADLYVICLGTNDLVQTVDDRFIKAFMEVYSHLVCVFRERSNAAEVYLATIPPVPALFKDGEDGPVRKLNQAIASVARESRTMLIDLYEAFGDHSDLFLDGVHPNPDGARLIAEIIHKGIRQTFPEYLLEGQP